MDNIAKSNKQQFVDNTRKCAEKGSFIARYAFGRGVVEELLILDAEWGYPNILGKHVVGNKNITRAVEEAHSQGVSRGHLEQVYQGYFRPKFGTVANPVLLKAECT
jgi:hypothetical protein